MTPANFALSWDGRVIEQTGAKEAKAGDVISITWKPCVIGGKPAETITGVDTKFLPRGILLDLLKIERRGDECIARYRVRRAAR